MVLCQAGLNESTNQYAPKIRRERGWLRVYGIRAGGIHDRGFSHVEQEPVLQAASTIVPHTLLRDMLILTTTVLQAGRKLPPPGNRNRQ